jgi:hypothetical protein
MRVRSSSSRQTGGVAVSDDLTEDVRPCYPTCEVEPEGAVSRGRLIPFETAT